MIRSFGDETTADLFRERNSRSARRVPRELWRVVQRKLKLLDAAGRLDDLTVPAGNRLELLKGDQAGRHGRLVDTSHGVNDCSRVDHPVNMDHPRRMQESRCASC